MGALRFLLFPKLGNKLAFKLHTFISPCLTSRFLRKSLG